MKKIKNQPNEREGLAPTVARIALFFGLGIIVGVMLLVGIARLTWHSKFYPGVTVAKVEIAGLTREQAKPKLSKAIAEYQTKLTFNGNSWETPKESVNVEIDSTLNEAYHYGRRVQIADYLLLLINKKTNYPLVLAEGKTDKMEALISEIADTVEIPLIDPMIEIVGKEIKITNGSDGTTINTELLNQKIEENYRNLKKEPVEVLTTASKRQLNQEKIEELKNRAEKLMSKEILLTLDDERITLKAKELMNFLSTRGESELVNTIAIKEYSEGLRESLNKDPQDAKFEFVDGKVTEFAPGKDGVEVDVTLTANSIQRAVEKLINNENVNEKIEISVTRTPPKVTTEKVNELGIRERIGRGESYYQHSIPNRIFNVGLASSRINSALVPPGEEISFNKMVGEVSGETGYQPAYIISGGRTILGDGGGLCQVSTTMFRAAMSAGLPILERWGHAYRVSYYELNSKPGVDATVIAPSKDFKFKNDTPGHILIQTINDPKALHLVIEIYGTSDGRVAEMSEPKVWGNTPPLPTIYQDDPSLPVGTTKQVDWAAAGAKASFEYKVTRNGETLQEKTFSTTYRPWASVFLRGTGQ
ncbi:MAG: VanW family protein [bacterium]